MPWSAPVPDRSLIALTPASAPALAVRPASATEQSGRRYLARACGVTAAGGVVITALTSGIFANLSDSLVGTTGMVIGLALIAIAMVAWFDAGTRKLGPGAAAIVLGVVSLPFAFGGLIVGALCCVIGGAMLVAYEPPTGTLVVETRRAGWLQRSVAALVDFSLVLGLQIVLGRFVPGVDNGRSPSNTVSVLVAWFLCWTLAVLVPTLMVRRTPGRLLVGLRLVDSVTGRRLDSVPAVARELARGALTIGVFLTVARTFSNNGFWPAMLVAWVGLVLLVVTVWFDLLDRATGSTVGHDVTTLR